MFAMCFIKYVKYGRYIYSIFFKHTNNKHMMNIIMFKKRIHFKT